MGVPTLGISRLPLGSLETKWHLGVGHVAKHIVHYKGEGGGFPPKFGPWWVLWIYIARGSSMHQKCSNYALTNLLFDLYRSMWIIDACHSPNPHPGAPTRPFTPKVLRAKERAPTPYSSIVFTLDSHLNLPRSLGVCQHPWLSAFRNGLQIKVIE